MEIFVNQRPCTAKDLCILDGFSRSLRKMISVRIVSEYRPYFNASDHYVMQGSGSVDSRLPRHDPPLQLSGLPNQLKDLTASPFLPAKVDRKDERECTGLCLIIYRNIADYMLRDM
ncbi:MAG: hypothetical protein DRH20_15010 [Deltaproteobacteria bacterium]|nr:MAG: hypothetical protein DRH20_15010 [Deltaproteobacteria bacterium]